MVQHAQTLRNGAAALIVATLLSACAAWTPYVPAGNRPVPSPASPYPAAPLPPAPPPPQGPSSPQALPPAAAPRVNRLSPATQSLVTQAHLQVSQGELPAASSTLDRALRIEPSNPLLWIELGRLRLTESDARLAEGCARKALALAGGDRLTQARAEQLLADALRAQGRPISN